MAGMGWNSPQMIHLTIDTKYMLLLTTLYYYYNYYNKKNHYFIFPASNQKISSFPTRRAHFSYATHATHIRRGVHLGYYHTGTIAILEYHIGCLGYAFKKEDQRKTNINSSPARSYASAVRSSQLSRHVVCFFLSRSPHPFTAPPFPPEVPQSLYQYSNIPPHSTCRKKR